MSTNYANAYLWYDANKKEGNYFFLFFGLTQVSYSDDVLSKG